MIISLVWIRRLLLLHVQMWKLLLHIDNLLLRSLLIFILLNAIGVKCLVSILLGLKCREVLCFSNQFFSAAHLGSYRLFILNIFINLALHMDVGCSLAIWRYWCDSNNIDHFLIVGFSTICRCMEVHLRNNFFHGCELRLPQGLKMLM